MIKQKYCKKLGNPTNEPKNQPQIYVGWVLNTPCYTIKRDCRVRIRVDNVIILEKLPTKYMCFTQIQFIQLTAVGDNFDNNVIS